jgi:PAS domain S-box-containing protein
MAELRFLLLEDSPLDAELIEATLIDGNIICELVQVKTRVEFETAIAQNGFDLILADYALPGFDGISALEIAQNVCPDLPFIFVTATMGEEVAIETLKSGATDYVLKQRLGRLSYSVRRALREAETRRARQQAESELNCREQEFRALVENSPDIIARIDLNLRHLYVNPAIESATGIPAENFMGKTNREMGFPEEICVEWAAAAAQVFETGEGCFYEFNFPAPDGIRYYQSRLVPEFALDGSIQSLLGMTRDVTEYKKTQEALQLRESQLQEQAEKLEQANRIKDEFLAILSHELRSPLNAMLGWAKLLRTRQFNEATLTRALEIIERNALLQTKLIEDLLDISRIIRGKLSLQAQPTSLVRAIAAAMDTTRLAAQAKGIDFRFSLVPTLLPGNADFGLRNMGETPGVYLDKEQLFNPKSKIQNQKFLVYGDSSRLQQIVWNLLSNAIKFTPSGGRVEIQLQRIEQETDNDRKVINNAKNPNQSPIFHSQFPLPYAEITVTDTGKGISSDFLPYVFDSFRQADGSITRNHGGLGLGLAIVRHLVELHGGTITAESPGEGEGAKFVVRLPLLKVTPAEEGEGESGDEGEKEESPLRGIRVLVVDDEPDTREFLLFTLEQYGAIATGVASASSALEILETFQPDLLLSDIGMPGEDGYSLIRKVRDRIGKCSQLPAVALTAYARSEDRIRALEAGFQTHVAKPIEPVELIAVVTNLVTAQFRS